MDGLKRIRRMIAERPHHYIWLMARKGEVVLAPAYKTFTRAGYGVFQRI